MVGKAKKIYKEKKNAVDEELLLTGMLNEMREHGYVFFFIF